MFFKRTPKSLYAGTPAYIRKMDQHTGVKPSYCGQCGSTCRGCLKEQLPDHPINKLHITQDIGDQHE
jgi:bacterioferritin-associated ferredoxin